MTINTIGVHAFANVGPGATPTWYVRGGMYGISVHVTTFGGGNVVLQRLSNDGVTWVNVLAPFTADGYANVNLINGTYRFFVTTATGCYLEAISIAVTS